MLGVGEMVVEAFGGADSISGCFSHITNEAVLQAIDASVSPQRHREDYRDIFPAVLCPQSAHNHLNMALSSKHKQKGSRKLL